MAGEGGQSRAGGRRRGALTARASSALTMEREARQGFLSASGDVSMTSPGVGPPGACSGGEALQAVGQPHDQHAHAFPVEDFGMRALFCGVRGSTCAPGPHFIRYGGHTSCVVSCASTPWPKRQLASC